MRSFTSWRECQGAGVLLQWWTLFKYLDLEVWRSLGPSFDGTLQNKLYHWKCMAVWRSCKGWPMRPSRRFCPQILYYEKGNSSWSSTSNFVILEQNVGHVSHFIFHHKIRPCHNLNCLLIILVKQLERWREEWTKQWNTFLHGFPSKLIKLPNKMNGYSLHCFFFFFWVQISKV